MKELYEYLEKQSSHVWNRLITSKNFGISQGEETLTDQILLNIAEQKSFNIKIIKTTKDLESQQGTDWEWWIGSNKKGWLRYAIQAKKISDNSSTYSALKHKVGKEPNQELQNVLLEKYASANNAIPLYAFYNHIVKASYSKYWNCKLPLIPEQLGITITPLNVVKSALNVRGCRNFEYIHENKRTIPIRCLALCPHIAEIYQNNQYHAQEKFGHKVKVYGSIQDLLEIDLPEINVNNLSSELYNKKIGIFPERIIIMDTDLVHDDVSVVMD